MDLSRVDVTAELGKIGWHLEPSGDGWAKCLCPLGHERNPSCSISTETGGWSCHACHAKGDIVAFLAHALKANRQVVVADLKTRYDLEDVKTIDADAVERYHRAIWDDDSLRQKLYDRCVTDELIRKYRLGADAGRIVIPITDDQKRYVNLRKYLPGAPGDQKMRNTKYLSKLRLWPHEQLAYDNVIVTGGEMKAIVTASQVNDYGWGCVTATGGEGAWDQSFNALLAGRTVAVVLDIDRAGRTASRNIASLIRPDSHLVKRVDLPLDEVKHPKGDLNDYFKTGRTGQDLVQLITLTEEWTPQPKHADTEEHAVHLSDVSRAQYGDKRVKTVAVASAISDQTYLVPKTVACNCDRSQKCCPVCPLLKEENGVRRHIPTDSPSLLEMIDSPKRAQWEALKETIGVPAQCKVVQFDTVDFHKVEDTHMTPQLAMSSRSSDRVMQRAFYVGHGLELNGSYEVRGRVLPHPKTQQSTLLVTEATASTDALTTFAPSVQDVEELRVFSGEDIQATLDAVYGDLEANVTHIFERRDMHLAVDLAYHSPLVLNLDGREVKGWVEVLILGDTAQGKTETTERMMKHYGLGERVVCKNATVAGLMGGVLQIGNKWYVSWGVIPTHDRRLVILEELKGADPLVIGKLTDMRSSGVAEVPKIERRRTHARTRLIAASNARSDQPLANYNFGVEAVKELLGSMEDVRRFDLTVIAAASQVSAKLITKMQRDRPQVEHKFTTALCRRLILWAWTRTSEQIVFDCGDALSTATEHLTSVFDDSIPLIDRGSTRYKIARLAASLACRTFSTDDGETCIVRERHVKYVHDYLMRVYSDPACGYLEYSKIARGAEELVDAETVKKTLLATSYPVDIIENFLHFPKITLNDLSDWTGWDRGQCVQLLGMLVRKHALRRDDRMYAKTGGFVKLLRQMKDSEELKLLERPDFIPRKDQF